MADRSKLRRGPKSLMDLKIYEPGYATDEERIYLGGSTKEKPIPMPNMKDINELNNKVDNSSSIFIGETLPEISERNEKTLYLKITDTISNSGDSNVKVSPTMGIKII